MAFTLLPAVDVADGQAVRFVQGVSDPDTAPCDPLEVALEWQSGGAEWIHLVDLDAAFDRGSNATLLASLIDQLHVRVQLSGGIGDSASLDRALSTGCERVVVSTAALQDKAWCEQTIKTHGHRITASLDVEVTARRDGSDRHQLTDRGSGAGVGDLWETLALLDGFGCARYVVTDIGRDGMMLGPNLDLYAAVTRATAAPVLASGGVSTVADLVALAELASTEANMEGTVIGKALYAKRFTLREALDATAGIS